MFPEKEIDYSKDVVSFDDVTQYSNTTNENNSLFVDGKILCNLEKSGTTTIKRNYLPRDVVNEKHVVQVFNKYEYKKF